MTAPAANWVRLWSMTGHSRSQALMPARRSASHSPNFREAIFQFIPVSLSPQPVMRRHEIVADLTLHL